MERERRSREYWEQELSEYWDSGLTVQEYSELKELPYEKSIFTSHKILTCYAQKETNSSSDALPGRVRLPVTCRAVC